MTRARDLASYVSTVNAAGKNFLINGGFDHFQRGTAAQRITGGQWWADRWTPALYQVGRHQRIALGYINPELNSPYALRVGSSSIAEDSNGTRMKASQTIESINALSLAGKKITLSYWVKFSNSTFTSISNVAGGGNSSFGNFNPQITYFTATTDGATGSTFPDSTTNIQIVNGSLPTTWTKYTITGTVPTNAKNVGAVFEFSTLGSTTVSDDLYYDVAQVQLEIGSVATTFSRAGGNFGAELTLCQRYYQRFTAGSSGYVPMSEFGLVNATTQITLQMRHIVPMRAEVNAIDHSGLSLYGGSGGGFASVSSVLLIRSSGAWTEIAPQSSGLTLGTFYRIQPNANTNAYIGFNAEF